MFDHLLESSLWDYSNKWLNIGFAEKIGIIEIKNMHLIWSPETCSEEFYEKMIGYLLDMDGKVSIRIWEKTNV